MTTTARPPFRVFYSWQADLANATNRGLIHDALEATAKLLAADRDIAVEPVIERDTKGLTGSPDIIAEILKKIDHADAFVADISFITPVQKRRKKGAPKLKRCPNPNVLLELGYALRRHGWERVVLVFNEHYGSIEDLPFDLRNRKAVPYRSAPEDTDRATPRRALQGQLEGQLRGMVSAPTAVPQPVDRTPIQLGVDAIVTENKGRASAVRKAVADVVRRISEVAPDLAKEGSLQSGLFIEALNAATPTIAEYLQLADAAANINDATSVRELVVGLEPVAEAYNLKAGVGGTVYLYQFDYWRQVGSELLLGLVGLLLRERHFDTLGEVLKLRLHIPNAPRGGNDQVSLLYLNARTDYHQQAWGQHQLANGQRYVSSIGSLLKERYSRPPLGELVRWSEIQAADLFLHMWAAGMKVADDEQGFRWIAHAAVLMSEPPRFLTDARRVGVARQVAQSLSLEGPEALRDLYLDVVRQTYKKPFQNAFSLPDIYFPNAHLIGSEP
jgi:hypothetical protein